MDSKLVLKMCMFFLGLANAAYGGYLAAGKLGAYVGVFAGLALFNILLSTKD